jgi:hypothetical protein
MFQLPSNELLLIVFILVQLTRVGCTSMFQLPNRLVEFTVLIFVQLTSVACLEVAYQSYVLTLLLVIQEFTAFSCAVLKDACLAFNAFCKST